MYNDKQIIKILLDLENERIEPDSKKVENGDYIFTPNKEADMLLLNNPNAFFLACMLNQGLKAEKVWQIPFEFKKRMGSFEVNRFVNIELEELVIIISQPPALHRYINTVAKWIQYNFTIILDKYEGDAANIWSGCTDAKELYRRLLEFKGIGQKKAMMTINILFSTFKIDIVDYENIDVAYDVHVKRVFQRSGISETSKLEDIVESARVYYPEMPGKLDLGAWQIGRNFCHKTNPKCLNCPIGVYCKKIIQDNEN